MKKVLFSICILLLGACEYRDDDISNDTTSADITAIMEEGIIIDTINLDYATIYQSPDNFPVIKPNSITDFINKNEILVYFDFISNSRETLIAYYRKIDAENAKDGFIIDRQLPYYDRLESVTVEVKKNEDQFYTINNDSDVLKFILTPEINSQHTFAKYELTIEEFVSRFKESFPEYIVLSFDSKETEVNTYIFRTTFKFNNNKEFTLTTNQIEY